MGSIDLSHGNILDTWNKVADLKSEAIGWCLIMREKQRLKCSVLGLGASQRWRDFKG
jgi:hypothetical protein